MAYNLKLAYELFCSAVLQLSLFSYAVMTLRKLGWKEGLSLVESGVLCDLIRPWKLCCLYRMLFYSMSAQSQKHMSAFLCSVGSNSVCFPMQCWK
jgi:hypothetical protein